MKKLAIILFLSSCSPKIVPVTNYKTAIQVSFTNEIAGNFFIQKYEMNRWVNDVTLNDLEVGEHIYTITYVAGLYRIKTFNDSTEAVLIK